MDRPYDDQGNRTRLALLTQKGVDVWGPERVYVSEEVRLDQIACGAVLMHAIVTGASTFIGAETKIGTSGLARIHESQIGNSVILGAGYYEHCVLLPGSKARGFAEFRQGTVLEEDAETGHNVGLKNTVFGVGAVAGSSINFCDVLLSGGSSRSDHSEIGSGVVHFNFDPRGDKFGSLMGDASGCLLRSRRIFVGGNSGIVAPVSLGFGAVIAAGSILRHDVPENHLSWGDPQGRSGDYDLERYFDLSRKFCSTAKLVGNLHALRGWYGKVRDVCAESENRVLYAAAVQKFGLHIKHRTSELAKVIDKLDKSLSKPVKNKTGQSFDQQHRRLLADRQHIDSFLNEEDYPNAPKILLVEYTQKRATRKHVESIRSLSAEASGAAVQWLREIAARPYLKMQALFSGVDRGSPRDSGNLA
jgi:hypothetical protein